MAQKVRTHPTGKKTWLVPAIVITVAVVLAGLVLLMNRDNGSAGSFSRSGAETQMGPEAPSQAAGAQEPVQPDFTVVESRDEADPLAVGPVDAPVGLVVFSDYQCPYCAKWSQETLPVMMEHVEAGNLRIEWRDLNLFGPDSERASRAAYAAALQGQEAYLDYNDALFANGQPRSKEQLNNDALIALAGDVGLDIDTFTADFTSADTAKVVSDNAQLGIDLGVYSTPAFLVGGQPIMGAQPVEVFEGAIDLALAE